MKASNTGQKVSFNMMIEKNKNQDSMKAMRRKLLRKEIWRHRELYLFLVPALIALIIFSYVPMYGIVIAFQDVKFGSPYGQNEWIGLHHFKRFFESAWIGRILKNTATVSIAHSLFTWPLPIVLALLLHNSSNKFIKKTAQTFSYLPHLLSTVIVVSIINVFCAGDYGLINIFLRNAGMDRISFFGEPIWVVPLYVISAVWQHMGYEAIVYLGALSAVDEELMEAAKIDGAGKLKCIWYIQLPLIMSTVTTMLILNMGGMFSVGADKMLLLQTDLNISASEIISTYVYKTGVVGMQYGFSAAVGLFQNIINLIMLLSVNKLSKKLSGSSVI